MVLSHVCRPARLVPSGEPRTRAGAEAPAAVPEPTSAPVLRERRTGDALRPVTMELGVLQRPSGSARVRLGGTTVVCGVFGPSPPLVSGAGDYAETGQLTCDFHSAVAEPRGAATAAAAVSGAELRFGGQENDHERSRMLKSAVEPALALGALAKCSIRLHVLVTAADGGELPAAVMAASLALADAGVPMHGLVAACSAGLLRAAGPRAGAGAGTGEVRLDPSRGEEAACAAVMTLAVCGPAVDEGVTLCKLVGQVEAAEALVLMKACHDTNRLLREEMERCLRAAAAEAITESAEAGAGEQEEG